MPPKRAAGKALTKSQLHAQLAESSGLTKKQVGELFDLLEATAHKELRGSAGKIAILPGLTLKRKDTKAKPARPGRNPFTGEEMMFKAKPAGRTVRATIGKKLKEVV